MSHYEERLQKDLSHLQTQLAHLAQGVEGGLRDAVQALLTGDDALAAQVILADHPINRLSREIDRLCHRFIAVHLPSAGPLRFVSAAMRCNIELERIGDYATTICRESVQLSRPPQGNVEREVRLMADQARRTLEQAVNAFATEDADLAKATMSLATQVKHTYGWVFDDLVEEGEKANIKDLFAYLAVFNMLLRVGDQAKNICEETVFAVTGQTKEAKIYRILFLDEDNAALAPLAQAIARKSFPQSGHYDRAARQAAVAVDTGLAAFLDERGIPLDDAAPRPFDLSPEELASYNVIVSLQGPVKSYIDPLPFHCTALEWPIDEPPADAGAYEAVYRQISVRVEELMTTLRGEEAP